MTKIKIIAAIGEDNELGIKKENKMPWHLPADLAFFKEQTLNTNVLMGRTTFESIGKPLPKRQNIVITTDANWSFDGVRVFNTIPAFLDEKNNFGESVYIIGGTTIYKQFIDIADEMILTEIQQEFTDADVFFPGFEKDDYNHEILGGGEDKTLKYTFNRYIRKRGAK